MGAMPPLLMTPRPRWPATVPSRSEGVRKYAKSVIVSGATQDGFRSAGCVLDPERGRRARRRRLWRRRDVSSQQYDVVGAVQAKIHCQEEGPAVWGFKVVTKREVDVGGFRGHRFTCFVFSWGVRWEEQRLVLARVHQRRIKLTRRPSVQIVDSKAASSAHLLANMTS